MKSKITSTLLFILFWGGVHAQVVEAIVGISGAVVSIASAVSKTVKENKEKKAKKLEVAIEATISSEVEKMQKNVISPLSEEIDKIGKILELYKATSKMASRVASMKTLADEDVIALLNNSAETRGKYVRKFNAHWRNIHTRQDAIEAISIETSDASFNTAVGLLISKIRDAMIDVESEVEMADDGSLYDEKVTKIYAAGMVAAAENIKILDGKISDAAFFFGTYVDTYKAQFKKAEAALQSEVDNQEDD